MIEVLESMRIPLETVNFEKIENKTFEVVRAIAKLCEFCDKPLKVEEKVIKKIHFSDHRDYSSFLVRRKAHDRVEIDLEKGRLYLYNHDYPGDVHPNCVERFAKKSLR